MIEVAVIICGDKVEMQFEHGHLIIENERTCPHF